MNADEIAAARARLNEESVAMVGVAAGGSIERWVAAREALAVHAPDDLRKALDALDGVRKLCEDNIAAHEANKVVPNVRAVMFTENVLRKIEEVS
jgi:hypothetical protein